MGLSFVTRKMCRAFNRKFKENLDRDPRIGEWRRERRKNKRELEAYIDGEIRKETERCAQVARDHYKTSCTVGSDCPDYIADAILKPKEKP